MRKSEIMSQKLKKVVGSVKLPENYDGKKELRKALEKKYLAKRSKTD